MDVLADGTQIAGYRIESLIGRGGMAVVYRAEDSRLGRKVALKLLTPELMQHEQFRARFIQESRIAASLDHPNIIPIYEAGAVDDALFIAMRYVEGSDLKALLMSQAPLDPGRVLRLFTQIGDALDAAHERGLVHRDVKPGNVLLAPGRGEVEHVYLTDFGLTKRTTSLSAGLTGTGHFLGTIDYVAPEQIAAKPVEPRTDIYAMGCMLYECLTGRLPFHRDDDAALLWAHLVEAPPPVTALRPDLSPEVDAVVVRAMAKSPQDRYGSCQDLVADLAEALGTPRLPVPRPAAPLPVADFAASTERGYAPAPVTGHPSFPPGASQPPPWDGYAPGYDFPGPPPPPEPEPEPAPRARRWLWPTLAAVVVLAVAAAAALYFTNRGEALSQHFTKNKTVAFSFDYPGNWREQQSGVNTVFSPRADALGSLFVSNQWGQTASVLRSDPGDVVGLYTSFGFTQLDSQDPEALRQGLQSLLPDDATFEPGQRVVPLKGVSARELQGRLVDPASGTELRLVSYVVQVQEPENTSVVLVFVSSPSDFDHNSKLFDRIVATADFLS